MTSGVSGTSLAVLKITKRFEWIIEIPIKLNVNGINLKTFLSSKVSTHAKSRAEDDKTRE